MGDSSRPLQLAVPVRDVRYPPPQGCRNGWPQGNSGAVWSEFASLVHFHEYPMAWFHLLNLSPCFTFTSSSKVVTQILEQDHFMWSDNTAQTWDRQNRLRRLVLFLWQTSYQCLINNILMANHLVAPTSTHFLGDTRACDRVEWLCHVRLQ